MPNYKKKVTTTKGGASPLSSLQQILGLGILPSLFMGKPKPVKKITKYKRK